MQHTLLSYEGVSHVTELENENDESAEYFFVFFGGENSIVSFLGQSFALFGLKGRGTKR